MGRLPSRRWAAARQQALERDGWRCQECGKAGVMEVHHVQPIHDGGAPFDLTNLLTLCRGCHIDLHIKRRMPQEWQNLVCDMLAKQP